MGDEEDMTTQCPIHLECYTDDPAILSCGHNLCVNCAQGWLPSNNNTCPLCRQVSLFPHTNQPWHVDVGAFQRMQALSRLRQEVQRNRDETERLVLDQQNATERLEACTRVLEAHLAAAREITAARESAEAAAQRVAEARAEFEEAQRQTQEATHALDAARAQQRAQQCGRSVTVLPAVSYAFTTTAGPLSGWDHSKAKDPRVPCTAWLSNELSLWYPFYSFHFEYEISVELRVRGGGVSPGKQRARCMGPAPGEGFEVFERLVGSTSTFNYDSVVQDGRQTPPPCADAMTVKGFDHYDGLFEGSVEGQCPVVRDLVSRVSISSAKECTEVVKDSASSWQIQPQWSPSEMMNRVVATALRHACEDRARRLVAIENMTSMRLSVTVWKATVKLLFLPIHTAHIEADNTVRGGIGIAGWDGGDAAYVVDSHKK